MARELMQRNLDFLAKHSLGEVCLALSAPGVGLGPIGSISTWVGHVGVDVASDLRGSRFVLD